MAVGGAGAAAANGDALRQRVKVMVVDRRGQAWA
jgi:hypothetical protein